MKREESAAKKANNDNSSGMQDPRVKRGDRAAQFLHRIVLRESRPVSGGAKGLARFVVGGKLVRWLRIQSRQRRWRSAFTRPQNTSF